ncbi:DNA polymerase IV [Candidatus Rariloculus sp.]|uniref:DNA polymerase IV n=1 Tax=Candidatus Rariloculus sp. TaxID=3101265 RepID=UPI003D13A893
MRETWPRVVAHADMDAFYAAIEQLDNPALRGKPVLVGPRSDRGVVLTASYEARPWGVGSAMPMARARRLCPQAIVVPPRFERYQAISKSVMRVFADFSPAVEALSLDEAFLDMTGAEQIFGAPEAFGLRLKDAISAATGGLTATVGISATKYVAKVASGYEKPDGLTIVPPGKAKQWLAPQPVASLWGAGPKTQQRLAALGLNTIGDVAAADPRWLESRLGKAGSHFYSLAHARDPRSVVGARAAKSIGSERTLASDVSSETEIAFQLRRATDAVGRRLRKHGYVAHGVRVKLKRTDFRLLTRQRRLADPTNLTEDLYRTAIALLPEFRDPGPFRLVGVAVYELDRRPVSRQLDLPIGEGSRRQRLEAVLDQVDERFGPGAVHRAGDLIRQSPIGPEVNLDFLRDEDD